MSSDMFIPGNVFAKAEQAVAAITTIADAYGAVERNSLTYHKLQEYKDDGQQTLEALKRIHSSYVDEQANLLEAQRSWDQERTSRRQEITDLELDKSRQQAEIETMTSAWKQRLAASVALASESLKRITIEVEDSNSTSKQTMAEKINIQQELEKAMGKLAEIMKRLRDQNCAQDERLVAIQTEKADLEKLNRDQTSSLTAAEKRNLIVSNQLATLTEQKAVLENANRGQELSLKTAEKEISRISIRVDELIKQKKDLEKISHEQEISLTATGKNNSEISTQLEELVRQKKDLEQRRRGQELSLQKAQVEMGNLSKQNAALTEAKASLSQRLQSVLEKTAFKEGQRENMEKQVRELRTERDERLATIAVHEETYRKNQRRVEEMQEDLNKIKQISASSSKEYQHMQFNFVALEGEKERLESKLQSAEQQRLDDCSQIGGLKEKIDTLAKTLQERTKELETQTSATTQLEEQLKTAGKGRDDYRRRLEKFEQSGPTPQQLEASNREADKARMALVTKDAAYNELLRQNEIWFQKYTDATQQWGAEKFEMEKSVADTEQAAADWHAEYETLKEDNAQYTATIASLRKEINALKHSRQSRVVVDAGEVDLSSTTALQDTGSDLGQPSNRQSSVVSNDDFRKDSVRGEVASRTSADTSAALTRKEPEERRMAVHNHRAKRKRLNLEGSPGTVEDSMGALRWKIEEVRTKGFEDDAVPQRVWSQVFEQMELYDSKRSDWVRTGGPVCAASYAHKVRTNWKDGDDRYACLRCRAKSDVCIVIQRGTMDILPVGEGVYIETG